VRVDGGPRRGLHRDRHAADGERPQDHVVVALDEEGRLAAREHLVERSVHGRDVLDDRQRKRAVLCAQGSQTPLERRPRAAGRRTALEGRTTLKQQAADQFARMVAKTASAAVRDAETTGLVLVMAPRFMAMVDEHLPKTAAKKITARIKRDLVDVPRLDLQRRVNASLTP
jgi:protein required for attachment to host cells